MARSRPTFGWRYTEAASRRQPRMLHARARGVCSSVGRGPGQAVTRTSPPARRDPPSEVGSTLWREEKQRPDTRLDRGSGDGAPSYKSCRSRLCPARFLALSRAIEEKRVLQCWQQRVVGDPRPTKSQEAWAGRRPFTKKGAQHGCSPHGCVGVIHDVGIRARRRIRSGHRGVGGGQTEEPEERHPEDLVIARVIWWSWLSSITPNRLLGARASLKGHRKHQSLRRHPGTRNNTNLEQN